MSNERLSDKEKISKRIRLALERTKCCPECGEPKIETFICNILPDILSLESQLEKAIENNNILMVDYSGRLQGSEDANYCLKRELEKAEQDKKELVKALTNFKKLNICYKEYKCCQENKCCLNFYENINNCEYIIANKLVEKYSK